MRYWYHRESCACSETPAGLTGGKPVCTSLCGVKMSHGCAVKSGHKVLLEQLILS